MIGVVITGGGWLGGFGLGGVTTMSFLQLWIEPKTKKHTLRRQKEIKCFIERSLGGYEYLHPKAIAAKCRLLIENYNPIPGICKF